MSKILNHKTGRYVKADGPTGKRVLQKIREEPDEYIQMLQARDIDQQKIMKSLRDSRAASPDQPVVAAGDVNSQEVRPRRYLRGSSDGAEASAAADAARSKSETAAAAQRFVDADPDEEAFGAGEAGRQGGKSIGEALSGLPDPKEIESRLGTTVARDAARSKREAAQRAAEKARQEALAAQERARDEPVPPAPPAPVPAPPAPVPPASEPSQSAMEVLPDGTTAPATPTPPPSAPAPPAVAAVAAAPTAGAPTASAPPPEPAEPGPSAPSAPGPAETAATDEDKAIKAAAANPNILDDKLDINLIGKDSPEELREFGVVYRDLIDKIFQSHSFIRLSKQTAEEAQYKELSAGDDKVKLYQHAEEIVDIYRDHIEIEKPRYDISADLDVLKQQIHELYTIARHVRNNLGRQDKGAVLNSFNKVGVIVSASSMGLTLESLMAWAQQNRTLGGDTARVVPSSEKRTKHPVSKIPDGDLEPDDMLERPAELVDHDTGEFKSGDKELKLEPQAVEIKKDQLRGAAGSKKNKVRRIIPDLEIIHRGADTRHHQDGQVHKIVPKSKTQINKSRYTIC